MHDKNPNIYPAVVGGLPSRKAYDAAHGAPNGDQFTKHKTGAQHPMKDNPAPMLPSPLGEKTHKGV